MNFFSGDFGIAVQQSTGLVLQIINIMTDGQESTSSEEVQMHIKMVSSAIADILVLRTLCETLGSVLQNTNFAAVKTASINSKDILEEM